MTRKKKTKTTKFHAARLGSQRGSIPGAVRVYSKNRLPTPEHDWIYSDGTGRCAACQQPFLNGDMVRRGRGPKQHYICMLGAHGGGKPHG